MLRILFWLMGLMNDRATDRFTSPPAPHTSVCHLHGCGMPAHAGHVLCEGHLIADRIGYYDPTEGWGTE